MQKLTILSSVSIHLENIAWNKQWELFSCYHWFLVTIISLLPLKTFITNISSLSSKSLSFFALLSDHDAFGIMIFHQRNGKWFLRPKQRGLNSVDLFIKEPLFLLLTTADCAEETEKSRSRQRQAKNINFSKIWVDQWSRLLLLINLPNSLGCSYFTAVFFYCSSQFFSTEMKNEWYFKKIDVKNLLVGWRVFLVMYRKYGGTAKKTPCQMLWTKFEKVSMSSV